MFRRMSRERYLSDAELHRLMAVVRERRHVHQPRDHALFALLANTGIRPSEALALERSDLHPCARPAWFRVERKKKRKIIPEFEEIEISNDLAAILEAHLATLEGDRVFVVSRRSVQRLFKMYARRAGISKEHHLYDLRHTAATRMYVQSRDIKLVQSMLGHESPDMSCIYAHIPFQVLQSTVNALPVFV